MATKLGELKGNTSTSLKEQFERISFLVEAVAEHKLPGMIICGPPGWGKTYLVRNVLSRKNVKYAPATVNNEHAFVQTLFMNRDTSIILLDDTDQLAGRPACINIVKGAFGPDHEVLWDSREAQKQNFGRGMRFKIKAGLIWVSNRNYANGETRKTELEDHWGALISRNIRPIWIDTTNQNDAFRYIIHLATAGQGTSCGSDPPNKKIPPIWDRLRQPLDKVNSEKVVKFFIDRRNYLLELSPRCMSHIINIFHATRKNAEQRNSLLKELLAPKPLRNLPPIPYPIIIGAGKWKNVPRI